MEERSDPPRGPSLEVGGKLGIGHGARSSRNGGRVEGWNNGMVEGWDEGILGRSEEPESKSQ